MAITKITPPNWNDPYSDLVLVDGKPRIFLPETDKNFGDINVGYTDENGQPVIIKRADTNTGGFYGDVWGGQQQNRWDRPHTVEAYPDPENPGWNLYRNVYQNEGPLERVTLADGTKGRILPQDATLSNGLNATDLGRFQGSGGWFKDFMENGGGKIFLAAGGAMFAPALSAYIGSATGLTGPALDAVTHGAIGAAGAAASGGDPLTGALTGAAGSYATGVLGDIAGSGPSSLGGNFDTSGIDGTWSGGDFSTSASGGVPEQVGSYSASDVDFLTKKDGGGVGFNLPTLAAAGAVATGLGALLGGKGGGSGSTTVTNSTPPMSAEERELINLNSQLAQRQLGAIDQLAPFQRELLDAAMADTRRISANNAAYDAAFPPELQAQMARAEADRVARLGPVQDELLQIQLAQLRQGGRATPEQLESIKAATDASIAAGSGDIDDATGRGIGLIADELANSRGLRLSDSPISSEAALLSREGMIQKGSLTRNLRAGQATAALNYPLAVQQVQTAGAQGQQSIADAAQAFQANLRQQAYQNRLALTGQAQSGGIGLAGIGSGSSALNALTTSRMAGGSTTTNTSRGIGLSDIGGLAQGLGTAYLAYNRLGLGS